MKQLAICIILLFSSAPTLAEVLYRWVEPDGSITFSPTPPPAGVKYKRIASSAPQQPGESVQDQPSVGAAALSSTPATIAASPSIGKPVVAATSTTPRIAYAPGSETPREGIRRSSVAVQGGSISRAVKADPSIGPTVQPRTTVIASDKRQQCADLSKRVVSLERRLRSELSADEMDNTVVSIARYQSSYNHHCTD